MTMRAPIEPRARGGERRARSFMRRELGSANGTPRAPELVGVRPAYRRRRAEPASSRSKATRDSAYGIRPTASVTPTWSPARPRGQAAGKAKREPHREQRRCQTATETATVSPRAMLLEALATVRARTARAGSGPVSRRARRVAEPQLAQPRGKTSWERSPLTTHTSGRSGIR